MPAQAVMNRKASMQKETNFNMNGKRAVALSKVNR
jgi:hypothetical protein